jgi:hypothetical protein
VVYEVTGKGGTVDAEQLERVLRRSLSGKAPMLYAVLNARARIMYGRSFAEILVEDPARAAEILATVVHGETARRITAELIAEALAPHTGLKPEKLVEALAGQAGRGSAS